MTHRGELPGGPVLRGFASQVHPVFMLPPLAAAAFGGVIARDVTGGVVVLHLLAVFLAVYTAHLKDGYVDYYLRGEDDSHPLSRSWCQIGIVGTSVAFFVSLAGIWSAVGIGGVLITLPCWLLGVTHAPHLDMRPLGATGGYPLGVSLSFVGGYYLQTETVSRFVFAIGIVLFVLPVGIKIIDDLQDYEFDRSIGKHTIPVVIGESSASHLAYWLFGGVTVLILGLAATGVFPPGSIVAGGIFGAIAIVASRKPPELATMLLIRGSYVFFAALIIAVWIHPPG